MEVAMKRVSVFALSGAFSGAIRSGSGDAAARDAAADAAPVAPCAHM
jgi:hypothetical protein